MKKLILVAALILLSACAFYTREDSDRQEAIRYFNSSLASPPAPSAADICKLERSFFDIHHAMKYMDGEYALQLSWQEVAFSERMARVIYRDIALSYAEELEWLLGLTSEAREKMGECERSARTFALADTKLLSLERAWALESANSQK